MAGQHWYLNSPFFYVRAIVYFAVWLGLARLLRQTQAGALQRPGGRGPSLQAVSAVGFVLYALTMTFAAVDWMMSLTPSWHSTVFGLLIGTGQALSALAGAILCANALSSHVDAPLRQRFHDLGNLTLALLMVWAYLALMQFLIIWIEDLPEEIPWFLLRSRTSWSTLSWFVGVTHFALPFVFLLSRSAKRTPAVLAAVAALVLLACLADSFWLVVPGFRPRGFEFAVERPRCAAGHRRALARLLDPRHRTAGGRPAARPSCPTRNWWSWRTTRLSTKRRPLPCRPDSTRKSSIWT